MASVCLFPLLGILPVTGVIPTYAADLFVGDILGNRIWRVNAETGSATLFVSSIECPEDLERDFDGSLVVMQQSSCNPATAQIARVSADGSRQTAVTSPGEIQGVEGPVFDTGGNLYVQSRGNRGIFRLPRDPSSSTGFGAPVQVIRGANLGSAPLPLHDALAGEGTGILFAGPFAGDVLATAPNEFRVNRFTPGTPFLGPFEFAIPADFPLTSSGFGPVDAKQACNGDVYITDASNRLLRFRSDARSKEVLIDETQGLQRPAFLAILPDGIVYFTQFQSNPARIGRFDSVTNARLPDLIVNNFGLPLGLAAGLPGCNVSIDIKPGSVPDSVNPKSRGKIPVAILSTASFDAPSQVDANSLTFGRTGDEASLAFCNASPEDVNGDGLLDLVCHFHTQAADFRSGDTQGILKGETLSGTPLVGTDSVRLVPQQ